MSLDSFAARSPITYQIKASAKEEASIAAGTLFRKMFNCLLVPCKKNILRKFFLSSATNVACARK